MTTDTTVALARQPHNLEISVQAIIDRKRKIVEVMEAVMKDGEHYGKVPGCGDKPTLLKAGAEVLCNVFGLVPRFDVIEKALDGGHREYRVKCTLTYQREPVAECEGICSTMEKKYRWRTSYADRKCPSCGQATILKSKDKPEWFCWRKKGGCGETFALNDATIAGQQIGETRIENPDIADVFNTVLKMAIKRAHVGATLLGVGASDIMTQDLEDLPVGSIANTNASPASDADMPLPRERTTETIKPDRWEALSLDLQASLTECRTEIEVRRLAPKFNELPKGSKARSDARAAWDARIAEIAKAGAA